MNGNEIEEAGRRKYAKIRRIDIEAEALNRFGAETRQ
jgi:hypothetical protein